MPVYNEAATVGAVLDAVREHFDGEIIVVDDGSTDETPRVLAERDDVAVVRTRPQLRLRRALCDGFACRARARCSTRLITMDCDGQHEPAHIPQFLDGARRRGRHRLGQPLPAGERRDRRGAPRTGARSTTRVTAEVNEVTGWALTDAFCGFKAYRLDCSRAARPRRAGYAMPLELWAKAWRAGLTVARAAGRAHLLRPRPLASAQDLDDPEKRFAYYMRVWHERAGGGGADDVYDAVCVGAHPDDVEIGMGGTVAEHGARRA